MTSDGMDWLDDVEPDSASDAEWRDLELETVGTSARLALYNVVRNAFQERAKSGLTRAELAKRLDTSRALVSRWLARPSNMTIETAARLMFCMGTELQIGERKAHRPDLYAMLFSRVTDWSQETFSRPGVVAGEKCVFTTHTVGALHVLKLTGSRHYDGLYEPMDAQNLALFIKPNLGQASGTSSSVRFRTTEAAT